MANLAISAVCNQRCAYCFAIDYLGRAAYEAAGDNGRGEGRAHRFLTLDAFEDRLRFLDRSGIDEVRLLGGEPTLHPRFPELVDRARQAGKRVVVFTNGLMPEAALASLEALPVAACTAVVNVTPHDEADGAATCQQRRSTLARLGSRAMLGFNLYRTDADLAFLLPVIAESGCKPIVRIGLAQPCLSGANRHIAPGQYRAVALKLVRFARQAAREGVTIDVDCGFVRCMFSHRELEELQAGGSVVEWRCNPILDIGLEGEVIHCYPLSTLARLPLDGDTDAQALRSAFEARTEPYRRSGVFRECSSCVFKARGDCTGGCLAVTIRRFRPAAFSLAVPGPAVRQQATMGPGPHSSGKVGVR